MMKGMINASNHGNHTIEHPHLYQGQSTVSFPCTICFTHTPMLTSAGWHRDWDGHCGGRKWGRKIQGAGWTGSVRVLLPMLRRIVGASCGRREPRGLEVSSRGMAAGRGASQAAVSVGVTLQNVNLLLRSGTCRTHPVAPRGRVIAHTQGSWRRERVE